jgi:hypothetical protein
VLCATGLTPFAALLANPAGEVGRDFAPPVRTEPLHELKEAVILGGLPRAFGHAEAPPGNIPSNILRSVRLVIGRLRSTKMSLHRTDDYCATLTDRLT